MPGSSTQASTNVITRVTRYLALAAQSRWLRVSIGTLGVVFVLVLMAELLSPSSSQNGASWLAVPQLRTVVGAALLIALAFWLIGSRFAIDDMQARARAWERSIESMNVGIALYDNNGPAAQLQRGVSRAVSRGCAHVGARRAVL